MARIERRGDLDGGRPVSRAPLAAAAPSRGPCVVAGARGVVARFPRVAAGALVAALLALLGAACDDLPPVRRDGGATCTTSCGLPAGSLLVTEVLYNPAGEDSGQEWFELYNNLGRRIDSLAGVRVELWSTDRTKSETLFLDGALETDASLSIGEGSADGGTKPGFRWVDMPALSNSTGSTFLVKCCDGTEIAQLSYKSAAPWPVLSSTGGVSIQLGQNVLDRRPRVDGKTAADAKYWCGATTAQLYDGANRGSPGAKNGTCAVAGECLAQGVSRAVRTPKPGQIRITEIYANPMGTDDYKEWVEVHATADVDLNDLTLVHTNESNNTKTNRVSSVDCVRVAPGSYALLGCSTNGTNATAADYNGGVTVAYAFSSKQVLYNSACTLELKDSQGVVLSSAQHALPKEGVSQCLDSTTSTWGHSSTTGQFEGAGTPGNGACTHAQ